MSRISLLSLSIVLIACPDPAKDVAKAKVGGLEQAASQPASAPAAAPAPAPTSTTAAGAGTVSLSAANTKLTWVGSKVTGKHEGGFHALSGSVSLKDGQVSAVEVTIDLSTVYTDPEKLVGHLKSPDFFDVANHPTAKFALGKITPNEGGTSQVEGTLTLRGQTRPISFPAMIALGPDKVSATAEFSINRKDWGIQYPGMPDDLIRDEVVIRISIDAAR